MLNDYISVKIWVSTRSKWPDKCSVVNSEQIIFYIAIIIVIIKSTSTLKKSLITC